MRVCRFFKKLDPAPMRMSQNIAFLILGLALAGCSQQEKPDDALIDRMVGDWAPAVLENCDLRVKFGSNAIWVQRDGKTHKISTFHRVRVDGPTMDVVLSEGDSSKVLSFKTSPNALQLQAVRSLDGKDLGDSINEDADQKIKYLSMRAKTLFDLRRCSESN